MCAPASTITAEPPGSHNENMPEALLPLFPLNLVLLPGSTLPLHIFEDRYKEMMGEAIRDRTEFGVVQGNQKGILNIGCTATIAEVLNRYEDGRLDVAAIGRRRFEILLLNQERSYLRASVTFFDDDDDAPQPGAELRAVAIAGLRLLVDSDDAGVEQGAEQVPLSFRVGQKIPDLQFRQLLLSTRSETERLKQIASYLPEFVARKKRTEYVKKIAPKNGHGLHKTEIGD